MNEWQPIVGQRVRAKIHMETDMRNAGMGIQLLATKGEELIIRKVDSGYRLCVEVSHEHITDATFAVALDEIEPVEDAGKERQ